LPQVKAQKPKRILDNLLHEGYTFATETSHTLWVCRMSIEVYGLPLGFIQHIAAPTTTACTLANYLLLKGLSC
jgi:hypothetical protein